MPAPRLSPFNVIIFFPVSCGVTALPKWFFSLEQIVSRSSHHSCLFRPVAESADCILAPISAREVYRQSPPDYVMNCKDSGHRFLLHLHLSRPFNKKRKRTRGQKSDRKDYIQRHGDIGLTNGGVPSRQRLSFAAFASSRRLGHFPCPHAVSISRALTERDIHARAPPP
jgi:hypothetical protein